MSRRFLPHRHNHNLLFWIHYLHVKTHFRKQMYNSFSFRPYIRTQSEIKHFQFLCLTPQILRKAKIAIADSEIAQLTRLNFVYFHKYIIILLMYITISNEYCGRLMTKYTMRIHSSIKYHTFCLCPYQKKPICNLYWNMIWLTQRDSTARWLNVESCNMSLFCPSRNNPAAWVSCILPVTL